MAQETEKKRIESIRDLCIDDSQGEALYRLFFEEDGAYYCVCALSAIRPSKFCDYQSEDIVQVKHRLYPEDNGRPNRKVIRCYRFCYFFNLDKDLQ